MARRVANRHRNALRFRPLTTSALRRFLAHLLPDACND
jgi:hypothetical protein